MVPLNYLYLLNQRPISLWLDAMPDLSQSAIKAALSNDWEKAISLNQEILKEDKDDINALCRLAYAYVQVGKISSAKDLYNKALTIDRYNSIAQKNLEKISSLPKNYKISALSQPKQPVSPSLFIEEPGKTKSVVLINSAPCSILSNLDVGDPVMLCAKKHSIEVRDENKIYLGALPDDISFRLLRFLKGGNIYQVYIKNATKNSVSIFISEIKRGKRFLCQPSFVNPSSESSHAMLKDSKTHPQEGAEEINAQEEDEDV